MNTQSNSVRSACGGGGDAQAEPWVIHSVASVEEILKVVWGSVLGAVGTPGWMGARKQAFRKVPVQQGSNDVSKSSSNIIRKWLILLLRYKGVQGGVSSHFQWPPGFLIGP